MEINYDRLILGYDVPINENVTIHVPTIKELAEGGYSDFMLFSRIFVTSVREQFSGMPNDVDKIEAKYPTFWDMAFDDQMNVQVGQSMFGEGIELLNFIVNAIAYWTHTEVEDYRPLSNHKIISEKLDWIIDVNEFKQFSDYIKMITLNKPNEELIAPEGISSKPRQARLWMKLYQGRIRELQNKKGGGLGDKILFLQAVAPSYMSFKQIGELNYYQFSNLMNAYAKRYNSDREFNIYTAYKFDSSKMKLTDLSEEVALIKLNK